MCEERGTGGSFEMKERSDEWMKREAQEDHPLE